MIFKVSFSRSSNPRADVLVQLLMQAIEIIGSSRFYSVSGSSFRAYPRTFENTQKTPSFFLKHVSTGSWLPQIPLLSHSCSPSQPSCMSQFNEASSFQLVETFNAPILSNLMQTLAKENPRKRFSTLCL